MNTPAENPETEAQVKGLTILTHNAPWKAKSVWMAATLALLGGLLWIKDCSRQRQPEAGPPPGAASFSESSHNGSSATSAGKKGLKPGSPATFRLGVSYLGGFFIGWSLRRFLKATMLLGGAAIALLALGKRLGWVELDWASVQGHVRDSLAWLQGEAASVRTFLMGYLPSTSAACLGVFFGFRRK